MEYKQLRLGVVGYCPPTKFDVAEATRMLKDAYDKVEKDFPKHQMTVVSGLTNVGVLKLAYEEALERGWRTAGVACKKAQEFECFPVDEKVIVGDEWGEESKTFIKSIDTLVRIGIGPQSLKEAFQIRKMGKRTYEYNLPKLN